MLSHTAANKLSPVSDLCFSSCIYDGKKWKKRPITFWDNDSKKDIVKNCQLSCITLWRLRVPLRPLHYYKCSPFIGQEPYSRAGYKFAMELLSCANTDIKKYTIYFLFPLFRGVWCPYLPFFSSDLSWFNFLLDLVSHTFELHVAAKSTLFRFPFYIFLFISHFAVRTVLDRLLVSLGSLNTPNLWKM